MGTEAHAIRPNACAIRVRRGALWLHTCRRAVSTPPKWSATPPSSKQESGWPSACRARQMRAARMGGRSEDRGLPVGDRAGHGGAYGVRGSAWELNLRAGQGVPPGL